MVKHIRSFVTQTWQTKYQECLLEDLGNKTDCYTIEDGLFNTSVVLCGGFVITMPGPPGIIAAAACVGVASVAHTDQKGNCDEQSAEEQMFCQYLYQP